MALADRMGILEQGTIVQVGSLEALVPQPPGSFAEAFVRRLS